MKKAKRLSALLLSLTLAFSLMAGCSTPSTSSSQASSDGASSNSEVTSEPTTTGKVTDGEGWFLWDDEGKLTVDGRGAAGSTAVVSSGKIEASQAGLDIMQAGGNAVDAAVAVGFALGVAEPNSSGIGGGGFMTIRSEDGDTVFLDFRERAPQGATPALWAVGADGKVIGGQNMTGGKAVAVPGEVAGMWEAFQKYGSGKVTWEQVCEPSIKLAEEGFFVTPTLADDMASNYDNMVAYPEFGDVYLNDMDLNFQVGDLFKNPALGKTMRAIAAGGKDAFYTGELAEQMVAGINKYGGVYTMEDFANYEARWMDPVKGTYRGYTILSSPLPSSGGSHIIQALNIMENFDITAMGVNSAETLQIMSSAFRILFADRGKYMGDPDYLEDPVPLLGIINKEYAKKQSELIKMDEVLLYEAGTVDPFQYEHEDTTHYSVADSKGNIVAVTKTVNGIFGSKVSVGGLMLNNEMGDFSSNPASPNSIAPGKTPLSSMSPTIVLNEDGSPFLALGSPGATRIITTCVQIISNVIDHDMSIQDAINVPRIFNNAGGMVEGAFKPSAISYESRIEKSVVDAMTGYGCELKESDEYNRSFGSVNAIEYLEDGTLAGGADPRRDGKALGY